MQRLQKLPCLGSAYDAVHFWRLHWHTQQQCVQEVGLLVTVMMLGVLTEQVAAAFLGLVEQICMYGFYDSRLVVLLIDTSTAVPDIKR